MQLGNVIAKQKKREKEDQLERDAFLGWQFNISQPRDEKEKPPTFAEYLKKIGLKDLAEKYCKTAQASKEEIKSEKDKALKNAEKAITIFKNKNKGR